MLANTTAPTTDLAKAAVELTAARDKVMDLLVEMLKDDKKFYANDGWNDDYMSMMRRMVEAQEAEVNATRYMLLMWRVRHWYNK